MAESLKSTRHRYYLHRKLKIFCKVNAYERKIQLSQHEADILSKIRKKYIDEIMSEFNYSIQYTMAI